MKKIVPALAIREALNADKKKIEKRALKLKEGKAFKRKCFKSFRLYNRFC